MRPVVSTFEFSVHIRVLSSRSVAKRLAEAMAELLEDATCPAAYGKPSALQRAMERAQGLTVEVTGVTEIKATGEK